MIGPAMIGIDWGTSSVRAYRIDTDGRVLNRVEAARGILQVPAGGFADALRDLAGAWIDAGDTRVLLSGMVGSRQGWREAPYLPCPAGPADLAANLVRIAFAGADVRLVPGLSAADAAGVPEVMRGEETQIAGIEGDGLTCLPGSHSKWARVSGGRITGFTTYLSGEAFAAIRAATILGRMMPDAPDDPAAFDRGVAHATLPGHLLHHLFGVRTLGLTGQLAETASASYLSGLLIGHEVRAAMPQGTLVRLVGAAPLCRLYARAITTLGGSAVIAEPDAAARGLARIAGDAAWT
jgi:2-dehydro-3-deoxygalactonokinase